MMKKLTALALLVLAGVLMLTGCVAAPSAVDESAIDRPTVVVTLGETTLEPTVSADPEASAQPSATPEASAAAEASATPEASANPEESAEPVDLNFYNSIPAGSTLTLSGTHASGIASVCYRFDGGETTVVKESSVEVAVPDGAKKLELYVINGNGIASQWATYYLTVE